MYIIQEKYWDNPSLNLQEKFIMNEVDLGGDIDNDSLKEVLQVSCPTVTRLFKSLKARGYLDYQIVKGNIRTAKSLK